MQKDQQRECSRTPHHRLTTCDRTCWMVLSLSSRNSSLSVATSSSTPSRRTFSWSTNLNHSCEMRTADPRTPTLNGRRTHIGDERNPHVQRVAEDIICQLVPFTHRNQQIADPPQVSVLDLGVLRNDGQQRARGWQARQARRGEVAHPDDVHREFHLKGTEEADGSCC
jgi:hypothetical protein